MKTTTIKTSNSGKSEERNELIAVLAEISSVTQRIAAHLTLLERLSACKKEAAK